MENIQDLPKSPYTLERAALPHQLKFLKSRAKYPALVAGFGCMRGSTKIQTINGLKRFDEITGPTLVLSYDENNQRFCYSLSGGSYIKGYDHLYQISTDKGVFVASGSHRIFCGDNNYQPVEALAKFYHADKQGRRIYLPIRRGIGEDCALLELPQDAPHYSQKISSLMGDYANAARLYGQLHYAAQDAGRDVSPISTDAQGLSHLCGDEGDQPVPLSKHSHQDQLFCRIGKNDFALHVEHPAATLGDHILIKSLEHILLSHQSTKQSLLMSGCHWQEQQPGEPFDFSQLATSQPPIFDNIDYATVLDVELIDTKEPYWDMQVLNTNNYVDEFGFIHHNSGKTEGGIMRILERKIENPKGAVAYYLPTYSLIRDIVVPRIEEILQGAQLSYQYNKTEHQFTIEYFGKIILRTLDNPARIVGYEVCDSVVDELDTLPIKKAREAWQKIIARNRAKKLKGTGANSVAVVTTPEGFRFVYEQWVKLAEDDPNGDYELIKASTYDNPFLPEDYIAGLISTYPAELIKAYLHGEFVNLNGKQIYSNFNRRRCNTTMRARPGDVLHIGMDFNVGNMSAVIHKVAKNGTPVAVDEIVGVLDTPQMIEAIKERYPKNQFDKIFIYPDASGRARKTVGASQSDISLIEAAGLLVDAPRSNPRIKDRILSMQCLLLAKDGSTRYHINVERCPKTVEALEQQVYNGAGLPDKEGGFDHLTDALTYFVNRRYGIAGVLNGRVVSRW